MLLVSIALSLVANWVASENITGLTGEVACGHVTRPLQYPREPVAPDDPDDPGGRGVEGSEGLVRKLPRRMVSMCDGMLRMVLYIYIRNSQKII